MLADNENGEMSRKDEIMSSNTCPKCKHEISPLDKSCPGCGATLHWGAPKRPANMAPTTARGASGQKRRRRRRMTIKQCIGLIVAGVGIPAFIGLVAHMGSGANFMVVFFIALFVVTTIIELGMVINRDVQGIREWREDRE